jgi:serine/threonine protein kinase
VRNQIKFTTTSVLANNLNLTRSSLWTSLKALHDASVCHGDIRPEIIAVTAAGKVQMFDFSHAHIHKCMGEGNCFELEAARQFWQIT